MIVERKALIQRYFVDDFLLIAFVVSCLLYFNRSYRGGNLRLNFQDFKG